MPNPKKEIKSSKYQKIAISVAERIANGEYEVGEKLKSRTTIASTFNVSPETARKGLNILADLKILTLKHGSGAIVLSKEKAIDFINQYESTHSIAMIKEKIRDTIREQERAMEQMAILVNDFLMQSQSISKQYPLAPYEIICNNDSEYFGKSIGALNIWHQTGATIVAIEHNGTFVISMALIQLSKKGIIFIL